MPTVRWFPRDARFRHFHKCLQRFYLKKEAEEALKAIAAFLIIELRKRRCASPLVARRKFLLALAALAFHYDSLMEEIRRKSITVFFPSQEMQSWDDDTFEKMFRFRREDFHRVLDSLQISGKFMLCGRDKREQKYPAHLCLMVVLRRLSFPCRFVDLVNIFGLPSNRLCDIFHSTVDFLYEEYARTLNQYSIWCDHFPSFAKALHDYGAPYDNLVSIFDGHFIAVCRPGGLGNVKSRLDQSELYTGEKAQHGIKYLVAQFPNGITALSGPYKGKVHDGRMLRESRWTEILSNHAARPGGRHYIMFGDAGFCVSAHIQAMVRSYAGYIQDDARSYNHLMSRIRIYIENSFAESANVFSHLNFKNNLRLGGRRIHRVYEVANFLMNVRTTFYGNQFTCALQHQLAISLEEFLGMARASR